MRRNPFPLFMMLAVGGAMLCSACGSTQDAAPAPRPPSAQEQNLEFETRTDTVEALHSPSLSRQAPGGREVQVRFMVQIGAFRDPQNASRAQNLARERYHMPVLNDYDTKYSLYQIRIGFFETREAAYRFREELTRRYPQDYQDAWVVQLKR